MQNVIRKYLALGVGFILLCGLNVPVSAQGGAAARAAPAVIVQTVGEGALDPATERLARVEAIESVDLRARVPGLVHSIAFKAGSYVKKGDLLFVIERARYEALVAAAKAQVERAQATSRQARDTLNRNTALVRQSAMPRVYAEEAQTALYVAAADLAAAQANLEKAALDLSYTHIVAPLSGRIGQARFTVGNLVGPDTGTLARLVQVDPVRVAFSVTEKELVTLRQIENAREGAGSDDLHLSLRLPNGEPYDREGSLEFIEPEIDARTGTSAVRAVFPNPDGLLMPGQSVRIITQARAQASGPVVPQSAVLQDRSGRFVYVVDQDNIVRQRRIETGAKIGDAWAVHLGVDVGEIVVVQGVQRLADGMAVQPQYQVGGTQP